MDESDLDLQDGAADGEADTDLEGEDEVTSTLKKETTVVTKKTRKPKCKKKRYKREIVLHQKDEKLSFFFVL